MILLLFFFLLNTLVFSTTPVNCPMCQGSDPNYGATVCAACLAQVSLEVYCKRGFSTNAVFIDNACDPFRTSSPTNKPTRHPTNKPTRYIFPTQSPQTQADYEEKMGYTKRPSVSNPLTPTVPTVSTSDGTSGVSVGLAVAIVIVLLCGVGLFCLRRSRKRSTALHESEFGAGASSKMQYQQQEQTGITMT